MKRIFRFIKGQREGHDTGAPVSNLTEGLHAEGLIRQRPGKENKKIGCSGMGDPSFTVVDNCLFQVCNQFPKGERSVSLFPQDCCIPIRAKRRILQRDRARTHNVTLCTFVSGCSSVSYIISFKPVNVSKCLPEFCESLQQIIESENEVVRITDWQVS